MNFIGNSHGIVIKQSSSYVTLSNLFTANVLHYKNIETWPKDLFKEIK